MVFAVSYKHALVACSLLLCPVSAYAGTPSLNITLSHTDTSELKPISIARAQFLPDIDDNPYSYFDRIEEDHNRGGCQKNGFQYTRDNCPAPRILKNKCPFGTGYADCYCAGSPTCSRCCDGYYKLNSCDSGYEISGSGGSAKCILSETCFGDTAKDTSLGFSCSSCVNKSGQTLYTCSCTGSCSLSSCPSNGYCSTDCKGKYCLNSCKSGYSASGNSCSKDCVPNDCSAYPLYSQPANGTYETCSIGCGSGSYKYRLTGCNSGYYLDGTGCTKCDKVNTTCDTGKTLVNTCSMANGATVGDCVDCRDESSPYNPCYGYYICEGDKVGSGATCNCGSQTYYEKCLVKETCLYGDNLELKNNAWHSAYLETDYHFNSGWGYYKVSEKCTIDNGTKVFWAKECIASSKDYLGNDAPCKGYKSCPSGETVGGETCTCGGVTYGTLCLTECNYEDTPATCSAKGMIFTLKCSDESGNQFGECS